ncbi:MAG: hypothetical protein DRO67_07510 [Candidatus Asgardarchaeum californiense]|nr:MAG: hypothetical protein DRO67_07510 [Candidatus Asgardarchaeum californiense]
MKYLFTILLCLGLMVTSVQAEPTWDETLDFIVKKINLHHFDGMLKMDCWEGEYNCDMPEPFKFSLEFKNNGLAIFIFRYGKSSSKRWLERKYVVENFGNMSISTNTSRYPKIIIKNPQNLKTISIYNSYRLEAKRRGYSTPSETRTKLFFDDDKVIGFDFDIVFIEDNSMYRRITNALQHLQKLHKQRWPSEIKKEVF